MKWRSCAVPLDLICNNRVLAAAESEDGRGKREEDGIAGRLQPGQGLVNLSRFSSTLARRPVP